MIETRQEENNQLQERISELESLLESNEAPSPAEDALAGVMIESLESENNQLQERIHELEQIQATALEVDADAAANSMIGLLRAENEQHQEHIEELESRIEDQQSRIDELEESAAGAPVGGEPDGLGLAGAVIENRPPASQSSFSSSAIFHSTRRESSRGRLDRFPHTARLPFLLSRPRGLVGAGRWCAYEGRQ